VLLALVLAPEEEGLVFYLLLLVLQYITQGVAVEVLLYTQPLRYMDEVAVALPELRQLVLLREQAQAGMVVLHLVIRDKMVLLILAAAAVVL